MHCFVLSQTRSLFHFIHPLTHLAHPLCSPTSPHLPPPPPHYRAFQGNVPAAFIDIFPGHNITRSGGGVGSNGAWLDSSDPLFTKIATQISAKMAETFGASNHFEADGWFGQQTGPWLEAGGMAMAVAAAAATGGSEEGGGDSFGGSGGEDEGGSVKGVGVEGGLCPSFTIPTEAQGRQRAATVFNSGATTDDAVFVYQGYPWSRLSGDASCNKTQLEQYIKGFVGGVPVDKATGKPRLLILDLIADYSGDGGAWQLWNNPGAGGGTGEEEDGSAVERWSGGGSGDGSGGEVSRPLPPLPPGAFLSNASSIWCSLENWGGVVHIGGDIDYALAQAREALDAPHVEGVGLTPEGIDNNPAYVDNRVWELGVCVYVL